MLIFTFARFYLQIKVRRKWRSLLKESVYSIGPGKILVRIFTGKDFTVCGHY